MNSNLRNLLPLTMAVLVCGTLWAGEKPATTSSTDKAAASQAEMDQAMAKVRQIVNQPVIRLARTRGMRVSTFSPGWFHEGAHKPDFNNVDVRTSQERIYDKHPYVTSDLNPGVVFIGSQLEFNANTKYFYTDRSVPKKKLTETEMLEINRLYRIIGQCEQKLAALTGTQNPVARQSLNSYAVAAIVLVFLLLFGFMFGRGGN